MEELFQLPQTSGTIDRCSEFPDAAEVRIFDWSVVFLGRVGFSIWLVLGMSRSTE